MTTLPTEQSQQKKGWLQRLREGLKSSSARLSESLTSLLTKRKLDQDVLDELEEVLITADLGVATAQQIVESLKRHRFNQDISDHELRHFIAEEIQKVLVPVAQPLTLLPIKPHVILVVGVNGSGKTTTIGKLATYWQEQGKTVALVAGDTFRAAAVEQLKAWAERLDLPIMVGQPNGDPAGLAFDALQMAKKNKIDVLLIDTAGRLHNKDSLMAELAKIRRVLQKIDPTCPHSSLLVLDATVGQNAHNQVEIFSHIAGVTGLIMTKLDGTARGGVLVSLAARFQLPIHAIGLGEGMHDLHPFNAEVFAKSLLGINNIKNAIES
jgi:fused signal recognition particle receptor